MTANPAAPAGAPRTQTGRNPVPPPDARTQQR